MKIKSLSFILLLACWLFGCQKGDDGVRNMIVASIQWENTNMTDEAGNKYLYLVKFAENVDWDVLSGNIYGFEYELGYEYEIKVRERHNDPAKQDRPGIEYELVYIVSKIQKESENLPKS